MCHTTSCRKRRDRVIDVKVVCVLIVRVTAQFDITLYAGVAKIFAAGALHFYLKN